jgi:hypothetical protein
LQLFASLKGLISGAIRKWLPDEARERHRQLQEVSVQYVNHPQDLKSRAMKRLDLETVQMVVKRLDELGRENHEPLYQCIVQSLRDLAEVSVSNYEQQCDEVRAKHLHDVEAEQAALADRCADKEENVHVPALALVEKER